jgi:hypothetical protein
MMELPSGFPVKICVPSNVCLSDLCEYAPLKLLDQVGHLSGVIGSLVVGHDGWVIANTTPLDIDPELLAQKALDLYKSIRYEDGRTIYIMEKGNTYTEENSSSSPIMRN